MTEHYPSPNQPNAEQRFTADSPYDEATKETTLPVTPNIPDAQLDGPMFRFPEQLQRELRKDFGHQAVGQVVEKPSEDWRWKGETPPSNLKNTGPNRNTGAKSNIAAIVDRK